MTTGAISRTTTLVNALKASFAAALRSPDGVIDPVALLWTDADKQWLTLLSIVREACPELYTLGAYDSTTRTGPVIWLKCIIDRTLPDQSPPQSIVPIIYLPGVSRQQLRAGGECPSQIQPMIEVQYRGAVWHQRNGRDWTVESFLMSELGLGLDIAQDTRTRQAMLRSLPLFANEPIDLFRGRRLDSEDFDKLSVSDPIRDLLLWMSDSDTFESRAESSKWQAFRDVSSRLFGLDPAKDGATSAALLLVKGGGIWDQVWKRFSEAPLLYSGLSQLLRDPACYIAVDLSRSPSYNEEQEQRLRRELDRIIALPARQSRDQILKLEQQHRDRRSWVWTHLQESTLAMALEPLARLSELTTSPIGGSSIKQMVSEYIANGWRCDRVAWEALSQQCSAADSALVATVVRAIYEPWLDQTSRHFQQLIESDSRGLKDYDIPVLPAKDICILFVDGLRYDVSQLLQAILESRGLRVHSGHRIAPLPTVTATAKPVASPAHTSCKGGTTSEDFTPVMLNDNQPVIARRLRDEMRRQGIEVLDQSELGTPSTNRFGAWSEVGQLDELGHKLGIRLAGHINQEVEIIADRVTGLLSAGWRGVRIVTDHGWLLLPGGLPRIALPPSVVASKWARCASVLGQSKPNVPTYPWYWNSDQKIACPSGIACFTADNEYAHGGVSLQECIIPDLMVETGEQSVRAKILGISWRGMRCRVTVESNVGAAVSVDVRQSWRLKETSIVASIREVSGGEASVVIKDDKYEGAAASVVLLDNAGNVMDYQPTTVGEDKE